MKQAYRPPIRDYNQDLIQRLVQSVYHLNYHISTGGDRSDFSTCYDGAVVVFTKNGLSYREENVHESLVLITWDTVTPQYTGIPHVTNMQTVPQSIQQSLGKVLRHWIDTL